MQLRKLIRETIRQRFNEQSSNEKTLYHGTRDIDLEITDKDIWLTDDLEYAKIWGDNVYEVKTKLDRVLDTYDDLGNKKLTLRQIVKYLKNKGVDTSNLEYVSDKYLDEKFIFWELVSESIHIPYGWTALDVFSAGYDAIAVFEYGYSKRAKAKTFLVHEPKNKILSVRKLEKSD